MDHPVTLPPGSVVLLESVGAGWETCGMLTRTDEGRWVTEDGIVLPTSSLNHQLAEFGDARDELGKALIAVPPLSWIVRLVDAGSKNRKAPRPRLRRAAIRGFRHRGLGRWVRTDTTVSNGGRLGAGMG